jgi:hypothetical protein
MLSGLRQCQRPFDVPALLWRNRTPSFRLSNLLEFQGRPNLQNSINVKTRNYRNHDTVTKRIRAIATATEPVAVCASIQEFIVSAEYLVSVQCFNDQTHPRLDIFKGRTEVPDSPFPVNSTTCCLPKSLLPTAAIPPTNLKLYLKS